MFQVIGGDDDPGAFSTIPRYSYRFRRSLEKRKGENLEANSNTAPPPSDGGGKKYTYTTDDALFFVRELNNAAKSGGPNLTITSGPCRTITITRKAEAHMIGSL